MSSNTKISEMGGVVSYDDGDYITLVQNGTNVKILKTDFLSSLGLTGTIVQQGDVTSTPVLDKQGTVNHIRNLENGPGVKAEISNQDGIRLSHNFTIDNSGEPILGSPTKISPVLKSMKAGTGMKITSDDKTVFFTVTDAVTAANTIVINLESDFTSQTATTITLEAKKRYSIGTDLSTAKRFIVEDGVVLSAGNQFGVTLTYTGAASMFTITSANFTIDEIQLSSPSAAETYTFTDTSNSKRFISKNVSLLSTPKVGTFTGGIAIIMQDSSASPVAQGITLAGSGLNTLNMNTFAMASTNSSFVGIDFGTASIPNIKITDGIFIAPAGGVGIQGAASSANVPTGFLAKVEGCSFSGGMTDELSGIDDSDIRWVFEGNPGIKDTRPDAHVSLTGNATETVITGQSTDGSTAVLAAGTWTVESSSHFTGTTSGRMTYIGESDFTSPVIFPVTASMASGGSAQISFYLSVNGVVDIKTRQIETVTSAQSATANIAWQRTFQTNDFVELFIENNSSTVNVLVSDANGIIN